MAPNLFSTSNAFQGRGGPVGSSVGGRGGRNGYSVGGGNTYSPQAASNAWRAATSNTGGAWAGAGEGGAPPWIGPDHPTAPGTGANYGNYGVPSTDASQLSGSWKALQESPQAKALQLQNGRDIQGNNLMQSLMASGDADYLWQKLGLEGNLASSGDTRDYSKEGFQLSHDQDAALLDMVINNFGRDSDFLARALGLQGQLRDQDMQRLGLQEQGTGLDEKDLLTNLYRNRRRLDNEYTSRGGWFTPERGLSQEDLNKAWTTDQGRIDIQRAGINVDRAGVGTGREQDRLSYDQGMGGLNDTTNQAKIKRSYLDQGLAHNNKGADLQYGQDAWKNYIDNGQLDQNQSQMPQQIWEMLQSLGTGGG